MYAVIKTGGKQYKVAPGQLLKVELLDVAPGDTVTFNEVLMTAGINWYPTTQWRHRHC